MTGRNSCCRLSAQFGLPAVPEWSEWFAGELRRRGMLEPLVGFGSSPIAVKGTKKRFLALLSRGLKQQRIHLPEDDSKLRWQPASWFETRGDSDT